MSASPSYPSGNRPYRLQFVRETAVGVTPADPAWNLYADNARLFDPSIDPQKEGQRGLGGVDPIAHRGMTESSQLVVEYDLQEKSASGETFEDGSGNSNDALTDAVDRDTDNRYRNRHTVVRRMVQSDLDAANTISGSTSRDRRTYVVAKGGGFDSPTVTIDPSQAQPVNVELPYEFEKIRFYAIDQPTSSESDIEVWVTSTDNGDTNQTVTVEDEDAGTTDDIDLNGTTDVQSTETFGNIDAISLDGETAGDVEVYVDDGTGTGAGDQIAVIRGQSYYDHGEGDLGVPALGGGSNASAIDQDYEPVPTVQVERPDGTAIADEVGASSLTVANAPDIAERGGTPRPDIVANDRTSTVDATVWDEDEPYSYVDAMLRSATDHLRFKFNGGTLQVDNADVINTDWSEETSQARTEVDVTFEGQGITVDP